MEFCTTHKEDQSEVSKAGAGVVLLLALVGKCGPCGWGAPVRVALVGFGALPEGKWCPKDLAVQ